MQLHNFLPGKIKQCQICGSTNLIEVMNVGNQPLANTLIPSLEEETKVEKYPVNIIRCGDCTLLQLDFIVNQKKVYHPDINVLNHYNISKVNQLEDSSTC